MPTLLGVLRRVSRVGAAHAGNDPAWRVATAIVVQPEVHSGGPPERLRLDVIADSPSRMRVTHMSRYELWEEGFSGRIPDTVAATTIKRPR